MLPGQAEPVQPPGVSSGSQVSVTLETSTLFVEPGGSVTTSLRLLNMGSLVDHYSLKVEGLRPAWVNLSRNSVQLLPGREETVSLTIKPPLDSASLAGAHPYRVSVASTASSGRISRAEAVLNIAPFTRFDSEMHPEVFATGKNSRLMINNQGNRSETFRVIWRDPGDELVFHPSQADVQSPAGQSAVTEFWIEPRQAHWFGADRTYAFTADVYAPDGSARSHSGEFTSRPRYSTSLLLGLAALLGILACLAVVAALVIPGLLPVTGGTPTATPPQVVVVPGQETTLPLIFTPTTQFTLTSFPTNTPPLSPTITATLPPVANFQGTWQTNFANIDFASQDGRQVSGQYRWYGGANAIDIRGTVEDNTLKGTVASGSVSFQFTLRPDGLSFEGTWTGPQGVFQWCGVRSGALFDGCGFSGHWNTISDYEPDAPPTADLVQTGDRLTGTFFNGTDVGTIDGRLGAGGNGTHYIAIGQYTVGGGSGDFRWTLKDFGSVQFQGLWANSGGTHPWCGWRDFSSQPDPCFLGE